MKKHFGHTADQAIQSSFNPDKELLKVEVAPHEIHLSLNKDIDSITTHNAHKSSRIDADVPCDIQGTCQVSVYGAPDSVVSVSPNGESFVSIGVVPSNGVLTIQICAISLKCSNACEVVAV